MQDEVVRTTEQRPSRLARITLAAGELRYANRDRRRGNDSTRRAFELVTIGHKEAAIAGMTYETFGKGRRPAASNVGDCFAYACARSLGARLLYEGADFPLTDVV